jgi:hypothetical protein
MSDFLLPASERTRDLWARTRLEVWPGWYRLVSFPTAQAAAAAALLAASAGRFCALVLERDEMSLTVAEEVWRASPLKDAARAEIGPLRAITFSLSLDLDVVGYLAPAAARLAAAGISVVPQCAASRDHLLVPAHRLEDAVRVLEQLILDCRD